MNQIELIVANLKAEIIKQELLIQLYERDSVPMIGHAKKKNAEAYIKLLQQKIDDLS